MCIALGSFFNFAGFMLLLFAEIGNIKNLAVLRSIYLSRIDTSGLAAAIATAANVPASQLTSPGPATDVTNTIGLQDFYQWGLWNFCVGSAADGVTACGPRSAGFEFEPLNNIGSTLNINNASIAAALGGDSSLANEDYIGILSRVAFYFILVAICLSFLSLLVGFTAHRFGFIFASFLVFLAALADVIGVVIEQVIQSRVKNAIQAANIAGVVYHYGTELWILWGSAAALVFAILPYLLSCCCGGRFSPGGRRKEPYY